MIKFAEQIAKEIEQNRKEKPLNAKKGVNGEPFEKWLRKKIKHHENI